jgi:hypothetical protein
MGIPIAAQSQPEVAAGDPPVAYVYVSSMPVSNLEINAYAASSKGSLTKISGSPFPINGSSSYMALNGKWLFDTDGANIYSFAIKSNGALREGPASEVNAQAHNLFPTVGGPIDLFLDHSGQSLYDGDLAIDGTNPGYQSFKIIGATGQMEFQANVGNVGPFTVNVGTPLTFIGNNEFAYGAGCALVAPTPGSIFGYKRNSDGTLTSLPLNPLIPSPLPTVGTFYCPELAAADTTNHVAVALTSENGPLQIGVYTAHSDGTLTTTSTATNMPTSSVAIGLPIVNAKSPSFVTAMSMAPSGKLLAVAGTLGLQVFHFNGARPVTHYTGLLTKNEIDQMFWDNANHLYAISIAAGKLYVFTITPTSVIRAPGSPHTIANPQSIAVLPKR